MTQPAASKLLKDLEDMLGVELFERLPRGMRPTDYGATLIRHARMALASLSQAHDEIEALKAGPLRAGQHRRDHRAGHHPAAAGGGPGEAGAPRPAGGGADRDQRRPHRAAGAGQARHGGGPPVRASRQDRPALRGAGGGAGVCHRAPRPSTAGPAPPRVARPGRRRLDRACGRKRAAAPLRPDVPRRGAGRAGQPDRELGPALRHPHAAAERPARRGGDRRGPLLRRATAWWLCLPITLPCKMDAFGLITRTDRLFSPSARTMLRAIKKTALQVYGMAIEAGG